ncbi:molybdopterin cofactor-binding domain-containing protein [Cystobacter fuscus]
MADTPKPDTTFVEVHIDRRRLLTWMVAAPTLVIAARLGPEAAAAQTTADAATFDLFLALHPDGRIALTMPRTETGQGISTGMAMLVAEELDANLSSVDVRSADADPRWLVQLTGLSTTMRYLADPARAAAACARARLITAAAHRWHLPASSLTTAQGEVLAPDGRRAGYGTLAHEAAQILIPEVLPRPKSPSAYTLVGQPTGRVDARALVTGAARFTLDLPHPEAVCTVVARPPTLRGTVRSYDASAALALPGVVGVVPLPHGVAVAAGNFAQALAARDALNISWQPGPAAGLSDANIRATLEARLGPRPLPPLFTTRTLEARFDFPYLAHAPLETQDCVARVVGDSAEVWLGAQDPQFTQREVATALGWALTPGRVQVHPQRAGGAFGRRFFSEPAIEAALVSRALGRTVRLMWTRNDDMRQGRYRPASHHRLLAWVGPSGGVLGYNHQAVIPTLDLSHGFGDRPRPWAAGCLPSSPARPSSCSPSRCPTAWAR